MAENEQQGQEAQGNSQPQTARFNVQRVYVKDSSFEAPESPESFRKPYNPQVNFNINNSSKHIEDNLYEVVLRLTADVKQDDKTIFLAEVHQGGIFDIAGIEGEQLEQVLTITCPNVLFPYGREALDSLVIKGSFPALMLAPINFEAIYQQAKLQQQKQAEEGAQPQAQQVPEGDSH